MWSLEGYYSGSDDGLAHETSASEKVRPTEKHGPCDSSSLTNIGHETSASGKVRPTEKHGPCDRWLEGPHVPGPDKKQQPNWLRVAGELGEGTDYAASTLLIVVFVTGAD